MYDQETAQVAFDLAFTLGWTRSMNSPLPEAAPDAAIPPVTAFEVHNTGFDKETNALSYTNAVNKTLRAGISIYFVVSRGIRPGIYMT